MAPSHHAPTVIGFFGLPGSGKTSVARALVARLRARGLRVEEPMRETNRLPTPARIAQKARVVGRHALGEPEPLFASARALGRARLGGASAWTTMFVNWVFVLATLRRAAHGTDVVVLDQGIFQALLSISARSPEAPIEALWELVAGELPGSWVIACLDTPPEIARRRVALRSAPGGFVHTRLAPTSPEATERGFARVRAFATEVAATNPWVRFLPVEHVPDDTAFDTSRRIERQLLDHLDALREKAARGLRPRP